MAEATPPLADRIREAREKAVRWLLDFSRNTPPDEWCLPDLEVLTYLCDHNYDVAGLASGVADVLLGRWHQHQYPPYVVTAPGWSSPSDSPAFCSMFFLFSLSPRTPLRSHGTTDEHSHFFVPGLQEPAITDQALLRDLAGRARFPRPEFSALLRFLNDRDEDLRRKTQNHLHFLLSALSGDLAPWWPLSLEQIVRARKLWRPDHTQTARSLLASMEAHQLADGSYPNCLLELNELPPPDSVGDPLATACFARSVAALGRSSADRLARALAWLVKNPVNQEGEEEGWWPGWAHPGGGQVLLSPCTSTHFCLRAVAESTDQVEDREAALLAVERAARWLVNQQSRVGHWQTLETSQCTRQDTVRYWPAGRIFTQPYETVLILEALEAAAKALRMTWGPGGPPVLKIRSRRTLIWREREVSVSRPAALLVLKKLLERPRETVSYEDLIISAGIHTGPGGGDPAKKQTLRTYVRQLRDAYEKAKSEDDPPRTEFIENIHYEGYRLNLPTTD